MNCRPSISSSLESPETIVMAAAKSNAARRCSSSRCEAARAMQPSSPSSSSIAMNASKSFCRASASRFAPVHVLKLAPSVSYSS